MSEEAQPGGSGQSKKVMLILFFAVNLAVLGLGAFMVYNATIGFEPPQMVEEKAMASLIQERESKAFESVLYSMDEFTVNLTGLPHRKLRIEMHLEMLDSEGFEEVMSLKAEARDAIVRLLGGKSFADIESIQGKLFLKDQIATTLNKYMKSGVVKDVYFSQFLVQ